MDTQTNGGENHTLRLPLAWVMRSGNVQTGQSVRYSWGANDRRQFWTHIDHCTTVVVSTTMSVPGGSSSSRSRSRCSSRLVMMSSRHSLHHVVLLSITSPTTHPRMSQRLGRSHPRLWIKVKATSKEVDEDWIIAVLEHVTDEVPSARWSAALSSLGSSPHQLWWPVLTNGHRAVARISLQAVLF